MGKKPAFFFYASDFLVDTAEWTAQEVGVYIRLLCHEWVNGSIPMEIKRIQNQNHHLKGVGFNQNKSKKNELAIINFQH